MIRFYTDPHLGVNRAANTTLGSAKALQERLYTAAVCAAGGGGVLTVCLGDMFDNFRNPEHIHLQGMDLMRRTHMTLCGNHDVVNQADKPGTLEVLNDHLKILTDTSRALFAPFGKPMAHSWVIDQEEVVLVFVPHVANQDLFIESLSMAEEIAESVSPSMDTVLCLHCNYNYPEERLNETTLNLSEGDAERMLLCFDHILMGHEHQPAEHHNDRLIILGNTHPTSLADISDKRIAIFEDGAFRFEKIWDAAYGYAEFQYDQLPETTSVNFARVKGEVDASGMLETMKSVNAMWRKSPELFALKMEVTMSGSPVSGQDATAGLAQLPDLIRKELEATPELLKLWDELRGE